MKKIAIIGAGISGISLAQILLQEGDCEVDIFERNKEPGGIARPKNVDGIPFHLTGGHCFNSKYPEVIDFVFSFLPENQWNMINRKAKIYFKDNWVNYPIEYSLRQIYSFNANLATCAIKDFFIAQEKNKQSDINDATNLADWFRRQFGDTLAEHYFIPYNKKIWGMNPENMDWRWVSDKLPIPSLESFTKGLLGGHTDNMPHNKFYYPKSGGQSKLFDAMATGLNIKYNCETKNIERFNKKWRVNGKLYDVLVLTTPMDKINEIINCEIPPLVKDALNNLKYNKVTTMLWESDHTDNTWTYFPDPDTIFHRHIHIGNFLKPNKNYIITEALGAITEENMINEGRKFSHLKKPLSHHISDHAYVLFDKNYNSSVPAVKKWLKEIDIFSLGRFGEWEYYNMDICIKSALEMAPKILCR